MEEKVVILNIEKEIFNDKGLNASGTSVQSINTAAYINLNITRYKEF